MYHEQIARYTADHLREHIAGYLAAIEAEFTSPELMVPLLVPKTIEPSSAVGGLIQDFDKILPEYGIDVLNKVPSQDDTALWSYEYLGQINGMVHGGSREAVDMLIGRHERAVENFILDHRLLHEHKTDNFSIIEFNFATTEWSGAEDLSTSEKSLWLAAFSTNVSWFTSERGPDQHG